MGTLKDILRKDEFWILVILLTNLVIGAFAFLTFQKNYEIPRYENLPKNFDPHTNFIFFDNISNSFYILFSLIIFDVIFFINIYYNKKNLTSGVEWK